MNRMGQTRFANGQGGHRWEMAKPPSHIVGKLWLLAFCSDDLHQTASLTTATILVVVIVSGIHTTRHWANTTRARSSDACLLGKRRYAKPTSSGSRCGLGEICATNQIRHWALAGNTLCRAANVNLGAQRAAAVPRPVIQERVPAVLVMGSLPAAPVLGELNISHENPPFLLTT